MGLTSKLNGNFKALNLTLGLAGMLYQVASLGTVSANEKEYAPCPSVQAYRAAFQVKDGLGRPHWEVPSILKMVSATNPDATWIDQLGYGRDPKLNDYAFMSRTCRTLVAKVAIQEEELYLLQVKRGCDVRPTQDRTLCSDPAAVQKLSANLEKLKGEAQKFEAATVAKVGAPMGGLIKLQRAVDQNPVDGIWEQYPMYGLDCSKSPKWCGGTVSSSSAGSAAKGSAVAASTPKKTEAEIALQSRKRLEERQACGPSDSATDPLLSLADALPSDSKLPSFCFNPDVDAAIDASGYKMSGGSASGAAMLGTMADEAWSSTRRFFTDGVFSADYKKGNLGHQMGGMTEGEQRAFLQTMKSRLAMAYFAGLSSGDQKALGQAGLGRCLGSEEAAARVFASLNENTSASAGKNVKRSELDKICALRVNNFDEFIPYASPKVLGDTMVGMVEMGYDSIATAASVCKWIDRTETQAKLGIEAAQYPALIASVPINFLVDMLAKGNKHAGFAAGMATDMWFNWDYYLRAEEALQIAKDHPEIHGEKRIDYLKGRRDEELGSALIFTAVGAAINGTFSYGGPFFSSLKGTTKETLKRVMEPFMERLGKALVSASESALVAELKSLRSTLSGESLKIFDEVMKGIGKSGESLETMMATLDSKMFGGKMGPELKAIAGRLQRAAQTMAEGGVQILADGASAVATKAESAVAAADRARTGSRAADLKSMGFDAAAVSEAEAAARSKGYKVATSSKGESVVFVGTGNSGAGATPRRFASGDRVSVNVGDQRLTGELIADSKGALSLRTADGSVTSLKAETLGTLRSSTLDTFVPPAALVELRTKYDKAFRVMDKLKLSPEENEILAAIFYKVAERAKAAGKSSKQTLDELVKTSEELAGKCQRGGS